MPDPPLPGGAPAGGFRPVRPEDRARAAKPVPPEPPPEQPKPPDKPKPPEDVKPPRKPDQAPELPRPPRPEAEPRAENARLVALGRAAFASLEYGRAAQRFRQATQEAPREPLAHFLLAQALVALGKYREAVDAIHAGMELRPDWPAAHFPPLELYGANVADWPAHLRRLEDTLKRHPDDPVLLFLYGYELWFDGRREEAEGLFRRARPGAADPSVIDRFLRALPPAQVV
jgi:tetratricopeptide (TPR) repeat protein